jgi:hypothetical protein
MTKKNYMPKGYERVPFDTLPHSVPAGKVLVHNHVSHVATTPSGERGFHGWFEQPDASRHQELERCDCGWTGFRITALSGDSSAAATNARRLIARGN